MNIKDNRNIHDFAHGRIPLNPEKQALLRKLPGVDYVIDLWEKNAPVKTIPRPVVVQSIRTTLEELRSQILTSTEPLDKALFSDDALLRLTQEAANRRMDFNLKRVVNATGVVISDLVK